MKAARIILALRRRNFTILSARTCCTEDLCNVPYPANVGRRLAATSAATWPAVFSLAAVALTTLAMI